MVKLIIMKKTVLFLSLFINITLLSCSSDNETSSSNNNDDNNPNPTETNNPFKGDLTFNIGSGFINDIYQDGEVQNIQFQSNGKLIVSGGFQKFNGYNNQNSVPPIVRLNQDGTLDNTFVLDPSVNQYSVGSNIKVLPDDKILVNTSTYLIRLNSNGEKDSSFNSTFFSYYGNFEVQNDGKIIIGDGAARLNSNGSIDNSFNNQTNVRGKVLIQQDGKILIINRGVKNSNNEYGFVRLNQNGSLDTSFDTGTGISFDGNDIECVKLQEDGKILIGGSYFLNYDGNSIESNLIRVNTDGSLDNSFNCNVGLWYKQVNSILQQPDGKLIIAGKFSNSDYTDTLNPGLYRLNIDGTVDETAAGFYKCNNADYLGVPKIITFDSNGKLYVGGKFRCFNGQNYNSDGNGVSMTQKGLIRLLGMSSN